MKNTPYFIMHQEKLATNLKRLKALEIQGVHILHTLKSFNEPSILPLISKELSGMSISSKKELLMAQEAGAKYIHLYVPAFKAQMIEEIAPQVNSISFNSLGQWERFKELPSSKGIRINPKLPLPIPDHCNPNVEYSRLGVDALEFLTAFRANQAEFENLEGLHFHALFQSSVEGMVLLLDYLLDHYKEVLPQLKWLNLGGGHNFTNHDYGVDAFVMHLVNFQKLYPNINFYFEPGESVTKGCGEFICTVLDIVNIGGQKVVILDTSVETHLLDVAIVNMRLKIQHTQSESTPYFYELAGNSCMQGDYIGEYFFTKELNIGDEVVFENMMSYTMVKMTEFNGMERADFIVR